ncbi:hypothetical protein HanRHA438_Chr03g0128121 [Helianthus annuus]|nr:hypothetical protein HanRHA438_Chr03g0128121 [Helianthus annuus]
MSKLVIHSKIFSDYYQTHTTPKRCYDSISDRLKLSDRMFKCYPLSLVVIPTGCLSAAQTRGRLCHSL